MHRTRLDTIVSAVRCDCALLFTPLSSQRTFGFYFSNKSGFFIYVKTFCFKCHSALSRYATWANFIINNLPELGRYSRYCMYITHWFLIASCGDTIHYYNRDGRAIHIVINRTQFVWLRSSYSSNQPGVYTRPSRFFPFHDFCPLCRQFQRSC